MLNCTTQHWNDLRRNIISNIEHFLWEPHLVNSEDLNQFCVISHTKLAPVIKDILNSLILIDYAHENSELFAKKLKNFKDDLLIDSDTGKKLEKNWKEPFLVKKMGGDRFPLKEISYVLYLVLRDISANHEPTNSKLDKFLSEIQQLVSIKNIQLNLISTTGLLTTFEATTSRYKVEISKQGFSQILYTLNPFRVYLLPLPKEIDPDFDKPYNYYKKKLEIDLGRNIQIYEIDIDNRVEKLKIQKNIITAPRGKKKKLVSLERESPFFRTRVKIPSFKDLELFLKKHLKD